jgi:L-arabinokinase
MGGIADYTGSLVCEMPLDRAVAVALSQRDDRDLQVFSFNLHDEHKPFTFRIPLDALATESLEDLRREFQEPGRAWAGYLAGCLFILNEYSLIDLRDPKHKGINLALYSTVPLGAGVSSSAAIEVATMINLIDHLDLRERIDEMTLAAMCQQVENRVVGAPCGIMDQVTASTGEAGTLLRMICQPHELQPSLELPENVRVVGINSNVKHSVIGGAYGRTRCAAFMAHKMILEQMRRAGKSLGRELIDDPMNGYLANLDPDDYKKHFRARLPEFMNGDDFIRDYKATIDTATAVHADEIYPVQHAADHHILEARRVQHFVEYLEEAAEYPVNRQSALNRAGHLMYASHLSYTNDAMLGADECDVLVDLVRAHEHAGLYGAKITGGGSGGTVAILASTTARATAAITDILHAYENQTGNKAELLNGTSPGAWQLGTALV